MGDVQMIAVLVLQVTLSVFCSSRDLQAEAALNQCGCGPIENSNPAVFITFERFDDRSQGVLLRFHNNLECRLFIPNNFEYTTETADCRPSFDIEDGGMVSINFEVQNYNGRVIKSRLPKGPYAPARSIPTPLPGGRSAIFFARYDALRKGRRIAVPYICHGKEEDFARKAYRVYFRADELPQQNPLLKLTTSVLSQRFCVGDAEVSTLRMKLRLRYTNVGERPIILDKGSNVAPVIWVSKTVTEAAAGKRELVQSADIVTSEGSRYTRNQRLDSSFVVLREGSSFNTTCEVSIPFAVDDQNPPGGTIKTGDHVLQIEVITWWDSRALAEQLGGKWKDRGFLWYEPVQSEPMPFKIDQRAKLEDCQ